MKRIPVSTYRLQFNPAFTFRDAREVVAYLSELGITDCYSSPYLKARPGSTHGYDICDHQALNPELGSQEDYAGFIARLTEHKMGQILDVVPNHMSIWEATNAQWTDVLENGPSSPYATFFDIDWHPLRGDTDLENRVLLPILGSSYGETLEHQQLALVYDEGAFYVQYYERRLPLDPGSYSEILGEAAEELEHELSPLDEHLLEMQSILTAVGHLPARSRVAPGEVLERQREKEVIKRRLKLLYDGCESTRWAVEKAIGSFNGARGDPTSFNRLAALLDRQSYRLADWRVAAEEINYRRFFDINDLAALRTEDPAVFEHTHRLVLHLLREGKATGLRIDHPDGLWDPARYLSRLQAAYLLSMGLDNLPEEQRPTQEERDVLEGQLSGEEKCDLLHALYAPGAAPLYVVVEKILSGEERLPGDWAVDGTTGYDFANSVNGLFVDPSARGAFDKLYKGFIGRRDRFSNLVNSNKKTIMTDSLASEINMLAHQLKRIASRSRKYRDFTLTGIAQTLREVIACLPIYRTYLSEGWIHPGDRLYIEDAVKEGKRRSRRNYPIFDFLRDLLLFRWDEMPGDGNRAETMDFVYKFQQVTGPVMAKAMEDTLFYQYNRLISLNEVGGDPAQFGVSLTSFHRRNLDRLRRWPHSLLATSTHDTKRSEDVRARINVLSEIPEEWKSAVHRWNRLNRGHKGLLEGEPVPNRNEEYYLYQTLLGAWPLGSISDEQYEILVGRIEAHMLKALREAKMNTSWTSPNEEYEEKTLRFVRAILDRRGENGFITDFQPFQRKVAHFGLWNSLSQILLKITSPGVPDFYQGTEIWDFTLVDPDNRRPVDYALRTKMLKSLLGRLSNPRCDHARAARRLVEARENGRIKMFLIHSALTYRRDHRQLFQSGSYMPLEAIGRQRDNVCAFARTEEDDAVIVAVPRLVVGLTRGERIPPLGSEVWGDTCLVLPPNLPHGPYRNVLTGEMVRLTDEGLPLAALLASFPVALLEGA